MKENTFVRTDYKTGNVGPKVRLILNDILNTILWLVESDISSTSIWYPVLVNGYSRLSHSVWPRYQFGPLKLFLIS